MQELTYFNNFEKFKADPEKNPQHLENIMRLLQDRRSIENATAVDKLLQTQPREQKKSKKKVVNLQDLFNQVKSEINKPADVEDKENVVQQKELSPKSKRLSMWDQEDSDDEELSDNLGEPMVAICLICNGSFDSPEHAKSHIDKTLHEQFEMAPSFKKFKKDFEISFDLYK